MIKFVDFFYMVPIYRFPNGLDLFLHPPSCGLPENPGLGLIPTSEYVFQEEAGLPAAPLMRRYRTITVLQGRHEWTEEAPVRRMITLRAACLIRRNAADIAGRSEKNRWID